jgi:FixJ family two-component response regulator
MEPEPVVRVVDDDASVRHSLEWLLGSVGLEVRVYASAAAFLADASPDRPGCLVVDVRMPGMSGLDLHECLAERGIDLPVIVISGHADVPMAVRALKAGAFDFIEKPFNDQCLLDKIQDAIALDAERRRETAELADVLQRLGRLTPREREVLEHVLAGNANKEIARQLAVSTKTVESHRAHVMTKMGAGSLSQLVEMCVRLREAEPGASRTGRMPGPRQGKP